MRFFRRQTRIPEIHDSHGKSRNGPSTPRESPFLHGDDRDIAAIAARQNGLVHLDDLRGLGLGRGAIEHRVRSGRLTPVHRAVFLFGAVLPELGAERAALMAFAGLRHLAGGTAARLFELSAGATEEPIEVLVVGRSPDRRDGLRVRRTRAIGDDEVTTFRELSITTPARTILDIATGLRIEDLERTVADAWRRRLVAAGELERLVERYPGRPGIPALVDVLQLDGGPAFTRREAEERLLALIRAAGLPMPACNEWVCGQQVDLVWRERRLVVEFDGFGFHGDRIAFERDRARDARLVANGYRVLRVTWRRIRDRSHELLAEIAAALALWGDMENRGPAGAGRPDPGSP